MSNPTLEEVIEYCKRQGFDNATIRQRLTSSADECTRFIDRESMHSAALRPAETQALLDSTIAHRAKLLATLETLK